MNKRCQLIVEMEMNGKTSIKIDGKATDVLAATAMLVDDVCNAAKIPPSAFAVALPMFSSLKRRLNGETMKIDLEAIRREMERGGG